MTESCSRIKVCKAGSALKNGYSSLFTLWEVEVPVFAMGLWDSHPEGRMGKIIDRSVRTQRKFLLQYFLNFRPIHCMIEETTVHSPETTDPSVLLTRYMDNNYIALFNIPPVTDDALRTFFCLFHSTVYDIPMKWEHDGSTVTWCEASLTTQGDLLLKGVAAHSNPHCPAVCPTWSRWPDRWSPGCPIVLRSFIPALVLKSNTLCSSAVTRDRNLQTVIQGCGYKGYPWKWWWLRLRVKLGDHNLRGTVPLHKARLWYNQGKTKGG